MARARKNEKATGEETPVAEAEQPAGSEPTDVPAADKPADEPAAAEEKAADEEGTEPADAAPAAEPVAAEVPAEEPPAGEPAEAAEPEPKKPKKRLPRALRPARTRPKREASTTRKPITRLPKPESERGRRQERRGVVVSAAMDKTIVVKVDVIKSHPRYKKVVRRSVKFHAHDEQNAANVGDVVRIVETRPLSKTKRWRLVEVVEAAR
jgi:small subunit ribosomal protein S17